MERRRSSVLLFFSVLAFLAISWAPYYSHSQGLDIAEAARGRPEVKENLNSQSFVAVKAKRLKHAQVLWVNIELLREMGIEVPAEGLTEGFEQKILDALAFEIPGEGSSPDEFLDKEKTFYADIYGGTGVGEALGSGRAAAAGLFQIKGIGRTPLADAKARLRDYSRNLSWFGLFSRIWDFFSADQHSHGGATLREAMAEAAWGEILHRELPFGANRVVAIIGTSQAIGASRLPRALIVRQNSLRPAHYIRSSNVKSGGRGRELKRVQDLIENLAQLPVVDSKASQGPRLGRVVRRIVDRIGRKYGTEYATGFFHGATSPSNIDIRGAGLDHGPMTAIDGFTKAINVDISYNGDLTVIREELVYQLIDDLKKTAPEAYQKYIPKKTEVRKILQESFTNQVHSELLWRFGLPSDLASDLADINSGRGFAELLLNIGEDGNDTVISTQKKVPRRTGTYDLNAILPILADSSLTEDFIQQKLEKLMKNPELVQELLNRKSLMMRAALKAGEDNSVAEPELLTYIRLAAQQRNRTLYDLMRGSWMYARQYFHIVLWTLTRWAPTISSYVDGMTKTAVRGYEGLNPYQLILEEQTDHSKGARIRRLYDAQKGKYLIEWSGWIAEGKARIFDSEFEVAKLNRGVKKLMVDESSRQVIEFSDFEVFADGQMAVRAEDPKLALQQLKSVSIFRSYENPKGSLRCEFVFPKAKAGN